MRSPLVCEMTTINSLPNHTSNHRHRVSTFIPPIHVGIHFEGVGGGVCVFALEEFMCSGWVRRECKCEHVKARNRCVCDVCVRA